MSESGLQKILSIALSDDAMRVNLKTKSWESFYQGSSLNVVGYCLIVQSKHFEEYLSSFVTLVKWEWLRSPYCIEAQGLPTPFKSKLEMFRKVSRKS